MADPLAVLWPLRPMFFVLIAAAYLRLTRKLDITDITSFTYLLSSVCSVNPRNNMVDWYNKGVSNRNLHLVSLLALFLAIP